MASLRLFQLPKSAQHKVLKMLCVYEIMNLSFCSKKSKTFVKEYDLKDAELYVNFGSHLSIEAAIPENDVWLNWKFPRRLTKTLDCPAGMESAPNLSFIQLVRHFSYIFNTNVTHCFFSFTDNRYDIESIRRCLKGFIIKNVVAGHYLSPNNLQSILSFDLLPKFLSLCRNAFQDANFIRKVLVQNYDAIYINDYFPEYFSKLDNLLAINSAVIVIKGSTFSDKSLNRFLKIWMKISMPRLKKLQFFFADNRVIDQNIVLKGIKYTVNPPEQERMMWSETEYGPGWEAVIGGLEITRINKIKATIILEINVFKFYVWDE